MSKDVTAEMTKLVLEQDLCTLAKLALQHKVQQLKNQDDETSHEWNHLKHLVEESTVLHIDHPNNFHQQNVFSMLKRKRQEN